MTATRNRELLTNLVIEYLSTRYLGEENLDLRKAYPLAGSERKVLVHIALTGKQTKYDIEKKTGINHASVHDAIEEFKKTGFLEGIEIGKTRTGQPKTEYSLTFYGASLALLNLDLNKRKLITTITQKWVHLEPVLFAKYSEQKKRLGEELANNFQILTAYACIINKVYLNPDYLSPDDFRIAVIEALLEMARFAAEENRIHEENFPEEAKSDAAEKCDDPEETLDKWLKEIKQDPELKGYFATYVDDVYRKAAAELKWGHFLKQQIKN